MLPDFAAAATRWLFTRDEKTVLLFAIFAYGAFAVHWEVPRHIALLNAGAARIHRETEASYERDQARDSDRYNALSDRYEALSRRVQQEPANAF